MGMKITKPDAVEVMTKATMQVYAFEVSDGSLVDPFNNSVEFLLDVKGSL